MAPRRRLQTVDQHALGRHDSVGQPYSYDIAIFIVASSLADDVAPRPLENNVVRSGGALLQQLGNRNCSPS
jgi:hypothetical protein